ncbi:MAG: hypothetical protein HY889_09065 [Deltaproteobacteria bacterium]|nr:hypothetical protein [Deltaproteobacteria bacterium]
MKPVLILLAVFFAVRFLRKSLLARTGTVSAPETQSAPVKGKEGEEMVLDPVCKSYIPLSSALTVKDGGRTEHFCTEACRDKFLASR